MCRTRARSCARACATARSQLHEGGDVLHHPARDRLRQGADQPHAGHSAPLDAVGDPLHALRDRRGRASLSSARRKRRTSLSSAGTRSTDRMKPTPSFPPDRPQRGTGATRAVADMARGDPLRIGISCFPSVGAAAPWPPRSERIWRPADTRCISSATSGRSACSRTGRGCASIPSSSTTTRCSDFPTTPCRCRCAWPR